MDKKTIWNEGAQAGLALGLFTALFLYAGQLTAPLANGGTALRLLSTLLSVALWLVKFGGCLFLLIFLMKRFYAKYGNAGSGQLFSFGVVTALTSALIVAGVTLFNATVLFTDQLQELSNTMMQTYSSMGLGDSDMAMLERVMGKLPQIYFFTTLIYCFLFGTVASKIFASTIVRKDEFGDPVENQSENNQSEDNQNA